VERPSAVPCPESPPSGAATLAPVGAAATLELPTPIAVPGATFKTYPKLDHLFIEGEGKSLPQEYEKPGHVAEEVIADLAGWIKR